MDEKATLDQPSQLVKHRRPWYLVRGAAIGGIAGYALPLNFHRPPIVDAFQCAMLGLAAGFAFDRYRTLNPPSKRQWFRFNRFRFTVGSMFVLLTILAVLIGVSSAGYRAWRAGVTGQQLETQLREILWLP